MKQVTTFSVGDKVFAKVKGYPAWPAMIIEDQTTKYNVKFYGTGETGIVKSKDLFYYLKHKNTFVKSLKRKDYNDAIEEIERAIEANGGSDGNTEDDETDTVSPHSVNNSLDNNKRTKRKRSVSSDKLNDSQPKKKSTSNTGNHNVSSDKSNETQPKKRSTANTINENVSDNVQDIKSTEEKEVNTNQNERVDLENSKQDVNHSPHKAKIKINSGNTENKELSTDSDCTHMNEPSFKNVALRENNNAKNNKTETELMKVEDILTITVSVKIVSDDYLRALIAYKEHVVKNEDVYKKKPVEDRKRSGNEVVMAKLPTGKYIGIKYNRDNPPSFNNEFKRAIYDEAEAKTILSLKNLLEAGTCNPEDDPNLFETGLNLNETQIQHLIEFDLIERKRAKLKWLKIESSLIELDAKIKGSLGLDKADPKVALQCLEFMLNLDVDPLMLKKHPHVVDMVKRLRRYIGNVKEWNLTVEAHDEFSIDAEKIRDIAEDVYIKFAQLFNISNDSLFWDVFTEAIEEFKQQVKDMKESQIFALSAEPGKRFWTK